MRSLRSTALGLLLALSAAIPSRADLAAIDQPFAITTAAGNHSSPRLAARPDGSYLVVWETRRDSRSSLYGRLFGPGGAPLGEPFEISAGPAESASVALLPDSGFVVVWVQGFQIWGSLHDRDGRVRVPAFLVDDGFNSAPAVAAGVDGEWMAVWEEKGTGSDQNIGGRWYGPDGTPLTASLLLSHGAPAITQFIPGVTALPSGGFLAAWNEFNRAFPGDYSPFVTRRFPSPGVPSGEEEALLEGGGEPHFLLLRDGLGVLAQSWAFGNPELIHLDATGQPTGPSVRVDKQGFAVIGTSVLDIDGKLLFAGRGQGSQLLGQLYDPILLTPLGEAFKIQSALPVPSDPVLASAHPGQFLMVWESDGRLFGEILVQGCDEPGRGLCLSEGRFRVEVTQRNAGGSARAHAVPLRDDTGSFWFFSPSNAELLIKILDGRSLNNHFWVFYGSLSDVPYEIRVTDRVTGEVRLYTNPAGTLASRADVEAFPLGAAPAPPAASPAPETWKLVAPPREASVDCHSSELALCLNSSYRVTIDFVDPVTGEIKQARALPFSFESGAFWFFDEANLELFVKVLDGSAINGHIWIFHGALSDVDYTLTVRGPDGAEWSYHNRRGDMHSGADTSALPAPGAN